MCVYILVLGVLQSRSYKAYKGMSFDCLYSQSPSPL